MHIIIWLTSLLVSMGEVIIWLTSQLVSVDIVQSAGGGGGGGGGGEESVCVCSADWSVSICG